MKVHMGVTVLHHHQQQQQPHPSRPVPTISPTSEAGADASKKKKSCRLVPGTITIISGEGPWTAVRSVSRMVGLGENQQKEQEEGPEEGQREGGGQGYREG
ncbi:hypothetical protein IWW34DRAFT_786067 [Fusarium oxysporum f. sp. albedinis]|uniref:uncharacterized protein n=1 Tax=Fusarium oxysporum Fo47 TaxID=660027 RepID=UPI0028699F58|nr:uncharacterized protein FOBCDRAFT_259717 [Fusarium oxysporum Fo47]KAI3582561.1 hypothetical protein IWW34DRAFT_786067 [Fusarium oxysporum f. sp. albedinis]QKD52951.2 hypothetical protein FOBCDRAFT_259717 [Fusarium oxysporum Fo47]